MLDNINLYWLTNTAFLLPWSWVPEVGFGWRSAVAAAAQPFARSDRLSSPADRFRRSRSDDSMLVDW